MTAGLRIGVGHFSSYSRLFSTGYVLLLLVLCLDLLGHLCRMHRLLYISPTSRGSGSKQGDGSRLRRKLGCRRAIVYRTVSGCETLHWNLCTLGPYWAPTGYLLRTSLRGSGRPTLTLLWKGSGRKFWWVLLVPRRADIHAWVALLPVFHVVPRRWTGGALAAGSLQEHTRQTSKSKFCSLITPIMIVSVTHVMRTSTTVGVPWLHCLVHQRMNQLLTGHRNSCT